MYKKNHVSVILLFYIHSWRFTLIWIWIRITPDYFAVILLFKKAEICSSTAAFLTLTRNNSASVSGLYAFMSMQAEQTDREDWCPKSRPCPDLDEGNGHTAQDKAGQRRVWGAGWSASNNGSVL